VEAVQQFFQYGLRSTHGCLLYQRHTRNPVRNTIATITALKAAKSSLRSTVMAPKLMRNIPITITIRNIQNINSPFRLELKSPHDH
jgi:hypothetical protein